MVQHNLKTLGLVATGETPKTVAEGMLACVPEIVVRNLSQWAVAFSALGFQPFAKYSNDDITSIACSTADGKAQIILTSPKGVARSGYGHAHALELHGLHVAGFVFFCTSGALVDQAKSIALRTVRSAFPIISLFEESVVAEGVLMYPDCYYRFIATSEDTVFLRGFVPYQATLLRPDIGLGTKHDHIVQNVPRDLYNYLHQLFVAWGFEKTFGGADTVEFATAAFAPPRGIFDRLPFFAINCSDNALSQINVGIAEYGGPFVQHLAFHVDNYVAGTNALEQVGIAVMGKERRSEMADYYNAIESSFREIFPDTDFGEFVKAGGLYDADCEDAGAPLGLQQSFFKTLDELDVYHGRGRLTFFLELIKRSAHHLSTQQLQEVANLKGACAGFGKGNFANLAADVTYHGGEIGVLTEL